MPTPILAHDAAIQDYIKLFNSMVVGETKMDEWSLATLKRQIENDSELSEAYKDAMIGVWYSLKHSVADIHHQFLTAMTKEPRTLGFYNLYVNTLFLAEDYESAADLGMQYFAKLNDVRLLEISAIASFELGDFESAKEKFTKYFKLTKTNDNERMSMIDWGILNFPSTDDKLSLHKLKSSAAKFIFEKGLFPMQSSVSLVDEINDGFFRFFIEVDCTPEKAADLTAEYLFNVNLDEINESVLSKVHIQFIALQEKHVSKA